MFNLKFDSLISRLFNLDFPDLIQTLRVLQDLKVVIVPVYIAKLISTTNCDVYKTNRSIVIPCSNNDLTKI